MKQFETKDDEAKPREECKGRGRFEVRGYLPTMGPLTSIRMTQGANNAGAGD